MGYRPHTTLPHMTPSPRTTRQYTLPACWASYLVNRDASGLDLIEREAVDAFLSKWGHHRDQCLSVSREFVGRSQHCGLIADVCVYIFSFSPSSGVARPAMGRA
jgi:hypothetical protein